MCVISEDCCLLDSLVPTFIAIYRTGSLPQILQRALCSLWRKACSKCALNVILCMCLTGVVTYRLHLVWELWCRFYVPVHTRCTCAYMHTHSHARMRSSQTAFVWAVCTTTRACNWQPMWLFLEWNGAYRGPVLELMLLLDSRYRLTSIN